MSAVTTQRIKTMTISEIAYVVANDWHNVYFGAVPYLDAMMELTSINDDYGQDRGRDVVAYFISNAATWRGPTARMVKAELKARLK
jgi:hypothetical protein